MVLFIKNRIIASVPAASSTNGTLTEKEQTYVNVAATVFPRKIKHPVRQKENYMGFFGDIMNQVKNGDYQSIRCQNCGSTYSFNISRQFPYAICGSCLEKAGYYAKQNGDNNLYREIVQEFRRRGSSWS